MKELKLVVVNEQDHNLTSSDKSGSKEELQGWPLVGLSVGSFLQVIAMDQQTCILEVYHNSRERGAFYFIQGTLYNATCGDLDGEEAALEMVSWENVRLNIKHMLNTSDIPKKIEMGLMLLLMESSRRRDEASVDDRVEELEEIISERESSDLGSKPKVMESPKEHSEDYGILGEKLNDCMEKLKKDMGDALLNSVIISKHGRGAISAYRSTLEYAGLFHDLTDRLQKAFDPDSSDALGKYYIIDLSNDQSMAVVLFGAYQWVIVFDNNRVALGLFLNVIVPQVLKLLEDAIKTE